MRSGPGTTYDRIGTLPAGSRITVVGEQTGWYEFNFTFGTGWVAGQYTSLNEPQIVNNSGSQNTALPACNCNGPDLDCSDFATHSQAQACYNTCMNQRGSDVYQLDGDDNDGSACEALP
ncbi:MAG: SH3 domain-containing protein [Anaerolineae bacterium]|nr:SH3 domain-containing protein [Anaerolineae bacterium]